MIFQAVVGGWWIGSKGSTVIIWKHWLTLPNPAPSHHEEEDNDQYDETDDDEAEFGGCNKYFFLFFRQQTQPLHPIWHPPELTN